MCIGCKQCEGACAQQNKLPYDDAVAAESVQSEHKYTVVLTEEDKFMRRLCMHCEHPACAPELTTWVIFSDFFGCFTQACQNPVQPITLVNTVSSATRHCASRINVTQPALSITREHQDPDTYQIGRAAVQVLGVSGQHLLRRDLVHYVYDVLTNE